MTGDLVKLKQQNSLKQRVKIYTQLTETPIIHIYDLPAQQSHNKFGTVVFQN